MKHLRCSNCGYQTNAWLETDTSMPKVLCNGCYQERNQPENWKQAAASGNILAEGLLAAARDMANMPDWYQRMRKYEVSRIAEEGRKDD